jgi:large subunit ribosomal protein L21
MTQKFRRRKASKRLKGHTQPYVQVKIQHILKAGESIPVPAPASVAIPTPEPTPAPIPELLPTPAPTAR